MATDVPKPPYPNAPVVEAVLAFHFKNHIKFADLQRFAKKYGAAFPAREEMVEFELQFTEGHSSHTTRKVGYKLTNADQGLMLVLKQDTLSVIRLPPYTSWEDLLKCTQEVWAMLKKVIGHPELSRLSSRFINRLDLKNAPVSDAQPNVRPGIELTRYLKFGVAIPDGLAEMSTTGFNLTCNLKHAGDGLTRLVNVSAAPSPLVDHVSLFLDIDIATTEAVPLRENQMWDLAASLRAAKNSIFEASITDDARRLFA